MKKIKRGVPRKRIVEIRKLQINKQSDGTTILTAVGAVGAISIRIEKGEGLINNNLSGSYTLTEKDTHSIMVILDKVFHQSRSFINRINTKIKEEQKCQETDISNN